jgi:tetratricopeptide (TPR) repeat protein
MSRIAALPTRWLGLGLITLASALPGCGHKARSTTEVGAAVATLQVVRPAVHIIRKGQSSLARWEARVGIGAAVKTTSGRAWIHHDSGARTLLGPGADVQIGAADLRLRRGRIWVEAPAGPPSRILVGEAVVSAHRAGFELLRGAGGKGTALYVARGRAELRLGNRLVEIQAGQRARVVQGKIQVSPEPLWDDWTGGLAWPAPDVPTAPAGMGQIGARIPGSLGKASFPLAVRSLGIKTRIDGDLATTVVDQVFFNPASSDLEGVYRVRVPRGAVLDSFCIDRPGPLGSQLVCGYVKEKQTARSQYRKQVYVGSRDDPALLEWEAPGQYKAHIYPIKAGSTRRVVILYTEWLEREGDLRRWRYPMASAGSAAPLIQELDLEVDLGNAGARRVEAGMGATVQDSAVVLRRSDFAPRADFVLALHGGSKTAQARGYVSRHAGKDGPYFMVRLRPKELERTGKREGQDLVVVVDTSADTDPTELQLARTTVEALLRHLGPGDRVAVLGADLGLHRPGGGKARLAPVTPALIERTLENLSRQAVGGATDLGQVLTDAAGLIQSGRGGSVVYVGDGIPTVGEMRAAPLLLRLSRLAVPVRLYGLAVGPESNLGLLETLARHQGGLALRVTDRARAATAALQLVAHASRPTMSKVSVNLGASVERVFPARPVAVVAGSDLVVLGRLRGKVPRSVTLTGWYRGKEIKTRYALTTDRVSDKGELRRRWASARLHQLIATGAGKEEVAELGTRFGLITEHTSIYVPSARETQQDTGVAGKVRAANLRLRDELRERARRRKKRSQGRDGKKLEQKNKESDDKATDTQKKTLSDSASVRVKKDKPQDVTTSFESAPAGSAAAQARPASIPRAAKRPANRKKRRRMRSKRKSGVRGHTLTFGSGSGGRAGTGKGRVRKSRPRRSRRRGGGGGGGGGSVDLYKSSPIGGGTSGGEVRLKHRGYGYSTTKSRIDVHVYIHKDQKPHLPKRCSPASGRPLQVRKLLWRERLRRKRGVYGAAEVWRDARGHCELRRWRERRTLLRLILTSLGTVRNMAQFAQRFRRMFGWGEWAYLRRAVFARARTAQDLAQANRVFRAGRSLDLGLVRTMLAKLATDKDRIRELLTLLATYRKNVTLRLMTLHLLEGAKRHPEAERLCETVAGNPYADARLRTAVGEYWARRGQTTQAKRIFSEIVEFRPRDPRARRRLGDLYRTYGWFQEAYRQYQTLVTLAPHDTSVLLLMALAAAGTGRIDEALRLEQRVAASATGSGGAARWALLWTSIRLARLRQSARDKKDKLLLAKLIARTRRAGVLRHARPLRVIVTWTHPEANLELWGAHPGWRAQRAGELAPQFGIEAFAVRKPKKGRYVFEVRRVGRRRPGVLKARVFVLWNEGKPDERLRVFSLEFTPDTKVRRVAVTGRKAEVVK